MQFRQFQKAAIIIFVLFFVAPAFCADNIPLWQYMPLFKGAYWIYNTSDGGKEKFESLEYRKLNNVTAVICSSSISGKVSYIFTTDKLYRFKSIESENNNLAYTNGMILLDLPLNPGKTWKSNLIEDQPATVEILGTENIKTPAGDFKGAIKIGIRYSDNPIYDGIIWVAKGIGVVKTLENHFSKILVSYSIGNHDTLFLNEIDSSVVDSKLVMAKKPDETKSEDPTSSYSLIQKIGQKLSRFFTPLNLFICASLATIILCAILISRITRFIRNAPESSNIDSQKGLAATYINAGQFKKAQKVLESFLKDETPYPDLLNLMGISLLGQNRAEKALSYFRRAIEINPEYKDARINLAKSLFATGKLDEALAIARELLSGYPDYVDLLNLVGEIYAARNEGVTARQFLKRALEINPTYAKAMENLRKLEDGHNEGGSGA